jgi:hypothetical protein
MTITPGEFALADFARYPCASLPSGRAKLILVPMISSIIRLQYAKASVAWQAL